MRKVFGFVLVAALVAGCTGKGKGEKTEQEELDSLISQPADTLVLEEEEEERPIPKTADELFDDFIFTFIRSRKVQNSRIAFPLATYVDGKKQLVKKSDWKYDRLFADSESYVAIYDNMKQARMEKDTTLKAASFEWIDLSTRRIKKYSFKRNGGKWGLTSITNDTAKPHDASDFLVFYHRFVTDSAYQYSHVSKELHFVTVDPDDEFEKIEGTLDVEQWFEFRPQLPSGRIAVINYGQSYHNGNQKVMTMNGVSNSMQATFVFRKVDGEWMLTSYEN